MDVGFLALEKSGKLQVVVQRTKDAPAIIAATNDVVEIARNFNSRFARHSARRSLSTSCKCQYFLPDPSSWFFMRSPNPTLEVMQKVAAALEVSVVELLGEDAATVRPMRKSEPTSKLQKVFEDVGRLPRRQQEKTLRLYRPS